MVPDDTDNVNDGEGNYDKDGSYNGEHGPPFFPVQQDYRYKI